MKKVQVEGQLSLWDIEIPKKEISFTKIDEKVTKMDHSFTKVTPGGTVEEDILNKYRDTADKIIKTCSGRYIVHINNGSIHHTGK